MKLAFSIARHSDAPALAALHIAIAEDLTDTSAAGGGR